LSLNYEGVFEGWEIAVAKKLVLEFQNKWPSLRQEGFEDLVQECLVYWFKEKSSYDPKRGASQKTFMGRIVRYFLSDFADKASAYKRKLLYETESLEEYFSNEEDSPSEKPKYIPSVTENHSISLDLASALQELTPEQRTICEMLQESDLSPLQISQQLNKHHSHVYREIERIRQLFEDKGLKVHLKKI